MLITPNQEELRRIHSMRHPETAVQDMLELSRAGARHAYPPYSNFRVGGGALTDRGLIGGFPGCNMETLRLEGTLCGERTAIFGAVTFGAARNNPKFLDMISVSCIDAQPPFNLPDGSPCGACRQASYEFSHADTLVVIDDKEKGVLFRLSDLLPNAFCFGPAADPNAPIVAPVDVAGIEIEAVQSCPTIHHLVHLAGLVAENSYVPMSKRRIGAIVVTHDGRAFAGVSVDNSSFGLCANADRVAISRAVIAGATQNGPGFIKAIAIKQIDPPLNERDTPQRLLNMELMAEFATGETLIALENPLRKITVRKDRIYSVHFV